MKKFLFRSCLFLVPLIIGLAIIFFTSHDKEFAYHYLVDDCYGHGKWIHDRLYKNQEPVDIAFIGTSRTIQAIDEKTIEEKIEKLTGESPSIANLGYCRPGRNLHMVILKDLLKNKSPTHVFVEVRNEENRYGHPVFPHLANNDDLIMAKAFFNPDLGSDILLGLGSRIEYFKLALTGMLPSNSIDSLLYGYGGAEETANPEELQEMKIRRSKQKHQHELMTLFYNTYPRSYIREISEICERYDVELIFLFQNGYGYTNENLPDSDFYKKFGQIWEPPHRLMEEPSYWLDADHFNINGARELADWISAQIVDQGLIE